MTEIDIRFSIQKSVDRAPDSLVIPDFFTIGTDREQTIQPVYLHPVAVPVQFVTDEDVADKGINNKPRQNFTI